MIQSKVKSIVFAHDTVRVIEFLMAHGSSEIKEKLFQEMKDELIPLAKSQYASFFVSKIIRYGTKEQREIVFKKWEGKIAELMKHKVRITFKKP